MNNLFADLQSQFLYGWAYDQPDYRPKTLLEILISPKALGLRKLIVEKKGKPF